MVCWRECTKLAGLRSLSWLSRLREPTLSTPVSKLGSGWSWKRSKGESHFFTFELLYSTML